MIFRSLALAILVLPLIHSTAANAATRFVAPCGNDAWVGTSPVCAPPLGPKRTIQAAINASSAGDQISVLPGTYLEAIDLDGKAVHIIGLSGHDATILNGNGALHTVTCNSGETASTIVEGLRITGGDAQGSSGGGVFILFSGPTFRDCQIISNEATDGAGVSIALGSPLFEDCQIGGNFAEDSAGGIHVASGNPTFIGCEIFSNTCANFGGGAHFFGGSATVDDCVVRFNDARHGAGVAILNGSPLLHNTQLEQNEATSSGGGVYIESATVTMTHVDVSTNFAHTSGGGITVATGGSLDISQSDIVGNDINTPLSEPEIAHGGGIRAVNATITGQALLISGNEAVYGGGLASANSSISLTDTLFQANDASETSGALRAESGSHVTLHDVDLHANSALVAAGLSLVDSTLEMTGGSIREHESTAAAALSAFESTVHCENVLFEANQSVGFVALGVVTLGTIEEGDALFESCDFIDNVASIAGGAAFVTDGHARFEFCEFSGNAASAGGALAADDIIGPSVIELLGCVFHDNEVTQDGGAIVLITDSALQAVDCQFFSNHAPFYGGAIYASNADLDLVNGSIFNNTASHGAGVYLGSSGVTTGALTNCRVTSNEAVGEGGGFYVAFGAELRMTNCTVADNTAGDGGSAMSVQADADVSAANSIVWGNDGIQVNGMGDPDFRYSIIPLFQSGPGCFTADPKFVNAAAGNYRLSSESPALEEGINALIPEDILDVDEDGDTTEIVPVDRAGQPRVQRALGGDGGCADLPVVDLGAYERAGEVSATVISADLNGDGLVSFIDLLILLDAWDELVECQLVDLDGDGAVGFGDLLILLAKWTS